MKQIVNEVEMKVRELNDEELQNTVGGSWWEVRAVYGKIVFIFHLYDDDH